MKTRGTEKTGEKVVAAGLVSLEYSAAQRKTHAHTHTFFLVPPLCSLFFIMKTRGTDKKGEKVVAAGLVSLEYSAAQTKTHAHTHTLFLVPPPLCSLL